jgi:hypothetical protein
MERRTLVFAPEANRARPLVELLRRRGDEVVVASEVEEAEALLCTTEYSVFVIVEQALGARRDLAGFARMHRPRMRTIALHAAPHAAAVIAPAPRAHRPITHAYARLG